MEKGKLISFTVHIKSGQFLLEPERIWVKCGVNYNPAMLEYRWSPMAGSQFAPHCLEPVCEPCDDLYRVVGSAVKTVSALTINVSHEALANKYFTPELFRKYLQWACCQCEGGDCTDTKFLLLNNCIATVNSCGLLI